MAGIPIWQSAPHKRPTITITIILINFIIFILMYVDPSLLVKGAKTYFDVQRALAMVPLDIVMGRRLWTIFTAMFLHANLIHILGNMIFLFFFGAPVESVMGKKRYLLFYLLCGVLAAFFHIFSIAITPQETLAGSYAGINPWIVPTLGASGAISGVMGAYLVFYPKSKITMVYPIWFIPLIFTLPAWAYIIMWFLFQLIMGVYVLIGFASSVAFWAHIGGFLSGIALAPIFMDPRIKAQIKVFRSLEKHIGEPMSELYYDDFEY